MSDLLNETPLAREWVTDALGRNNGDAFVRVVSAVIWTNDHHGLEPSSHSIDPDWLVETINRDKLLLVAERDPGKPQGLVMECARFDAPVGCIFVVAILGFYSRAEVLEFRMLGLSVQSNVPPLRLFSSVGSGSPIQVTSHPQRVEQAWLERVMARAPIPLMLTEFTHETNKSELGLIRLRIPSAAAPLNPFDAVIPDGDLYPAISAWLRDAIGAMAARGCLINLQSLHDGCEVSFLYRGGDIKEIYNAWDLQPDATAQAALLIENLHARVMPARKLVFEFGESPACWFPSYAVLFDNRIVSDNATLMNGISTPAETIIDSVQWSFSVSNNARNELLEVEWDFDSPVLQHRKEIDVSKSRVKERAEKYPGALPCWHRAADNDQDG